MHRHSFAYPPLVRSPASSTFLSISQHELDQARLDLLRRRVTLFGVVLGLILIVLGAVQWWISVGVLGQTLTRSRTVSLLLGVMVGVILIVMPRLRRRTFQNATLRSLVWRTIAIVIMSVLSQTMGAQVLAAGLSEAIRPMGFQGQLGPMFVLVVFMLLVHASAAIIVPWTVLEACVPPAVWMFLSAVAGLTGRDSVNFVLLGLGLTLLAGLPGIAITFFRSGGLREMLGLRLIGTRYAEVERELAFARKLHERLFPHPIREGPIRLEYAYEPMRQIGGDYLDVSRGDDGSLLVVVIDVTGHGVAAALAVNRLHGEMKRVLAEQREIGPAALLTALNRYVFLTLADESVFATAAAARVWPDGRATLCVAGHPPPMVRGADARVRVIDPSAPILGPFDPDEFDADETEIRLAADETLVIYTDGAIEARDRMGRNLGQPGLERLVAAAPADMTLPRAVLDQVTAYRAGAAEDDVLVALITTGA